MKRQDAKTPREEPRDELDKLARATIGAAIAVHRDLGPGYLESVYEEALAVELRHRGLTFERQVSIPIEYRGAAVGEHVLDLIVGDELVVELKAVEAVHAVHYAQVHSYLKAGAFDLALLINFNVPLLKQGVRRIIRNNFSDSQLGVLASWRFQNSDPDL